MTTSKPGNKFRGIFQNNQLDETVYYLGEKGNRRN